MNISTRLSPASTIIRQPVDLDIEIRCAANLPVGTPIEFQFPNSWSLISGPSFTRDFQTADPTHPHFIEVVCPTHPQTRFDLAITPRHLNHPQGMVRHGRLITATLAGAPLPADTPIRIRYAHTVAPYVAETESLWLRIAGVIPPDLPRLVVQPGPHALFRLLAPATAQPGQSFPVRIVSLDLCDNLSSTAFTGDPLIGPDGSPASPPLTFTGGTTVDVQLSQPGVFRFAYRGVLSNAIRVETNAPRWFWGDLHIHTRLSHDAQGADPYRYARDVSGLDFAAVADHWESLGPEGYRQAVEWSRAAHAPGSFVTLPADERNPPELQGHHNVYFDDEARLLKQAALANPSSPPTNPPPHSIAHLRGLDPRQTIVIPHHTGIRFGNLTQTSGTSCAIDWSAADDGGLRPVMEIYSHHGQSESYAPEHLLAYEWNRLRNPERRANTSMPGPYYAQDYWMQGHRIGVIGSSDEHSGQGGRRHGGVAVVRADSLTRPALFEALRQRRCYATTGERIGVEFSIDGHEMGEAFTAPSGLTLRGRLRIFGTAPLLRVDLLRFRPRRDSAFIPILSVFPSGSALDYAVDWTDAFETSALYYARAVQEPLDWPGMAWTSPIWVDLA